MLSKALALEANNQVGFNYLDKKRAQSLLVPLGLQLPPQPNNIGSNIIIRHISSNVNRKIDTVLKSRQFIRWLVDLSFLSNCESTSFISEPRTLNELLISARDFLNSRSPSRPIFKPKFSDILFHIFGKWA